MINAENGINIKLYWSAFQPKDTPVTGSIGGADRVFIKRPQLPSYGWPP